MKEIYIKKPGENSPGFFALWVFLHMLGSF